MERQVKDMPPQNYAPEATVDRFFRADPGQDVVLTSDAAIRACNMAADEGRVVSRIEGGLWRNPGFEARLDCIWQGVSPPVPKDRAIENNLKAAKFIQDEARIHDAFILTAPFLDVVQEG
jgi:hypothetical protein